MRKSKKFLVSLLFVLMVLSAGCVFSGEKGFEETYSFEDGLEGWERGGRDLSHPSSENKTIDWQINRSDLASTNGNYSLLYYLENLNDQGKIWIQKTYSVEENQKYSLDVSFDFGTSDFGVNQWTIIAGPFESKSDSKLPYQDETGKNSDEPGLRWLDKSYSFRTSSGVDGKITVLIGVWGTWEAPRTYLIDNVTIGYEKIG